MLCSPFCKAFNANWYFILFCLGSIKPGAKGGGDNREETCVLFLDRLADMGRRSRPRVRERERPADLGRFFLLRLPRRMGFD